MRLKRLEPIRTIMEDTTTDAGKIEEEAEAEATICIVLSAARLTIPLISATRSNEWTKKTNLRKAD